MMNYRKLLEEILMIYNNWGEVLNQRPMSKNRQATNKRKNQDFQIKILRPLCE